MHWELVGMAAEVPRLMPWWQVCGWLAGMACATCYGFRASRSSSHPFESKLLTWLCIALYAVVSLAAAFMIHPQNQASRIIRTPLLSPGDCQFLVRRSTAHAEEGGGWTTSRHRNYPTTDLPLYEIDSLATWWNATVQPRLEALMREQLQVPEWAGFQMRDLFVVRYDAEGQRGLELHADGSHISYNIALSAADDYTGGGTWFNGPGKAVSLTQGEVLMHESHLLHAGIDISQGERFILVGFVWITPLSACWWRSFGTVASSFEMADLGSQSSTVEQAWRIQILWDMLLHFVRGAWETAWESWTVCILLAVLVALVCMLAALLGLLCFDLYEHLSLIHISEPTRLLSISYAVFCLKKKKKTDELH
eukprot:TRINITY_DN2801_c0_g1_i4.p1 TRINITY_DN2801_c0_g1~~TRINITY_DN2801_c0_g1_i4.p1  ORF type:complete len:365 (+),score=81.10 TRINITY_DN2801_c0_g1_i4:67-1161(+)